VPRKKKKEIYEEKRIVGCYEWVRLDENPTGFALGFAMAFIHGIRVFFLIIK
jgi:hypothetical protein